VHQSYSFINVWSDARHQHLKQVRLSSGTAVYSYMPILRMARAHASNARAMVAQREYAHWATVARAMRVIHQILGFWVSKAPQNGRFPAFDANEQNLTPLALSYKQNYKQ